MQKRSPTKLPSLVEPLSSAACSPNKKGNLECVKFPPIGKQKEAKEQVPVTNESRSSTSRKDRLQEKSAKIEGGQQPLVPELTARMKASMNEILNVCPQRRSNLELPVVDDSIPIWYSDWVQTIVSSKLDWRYHPDGLRDSLLREILGIYSKSFPPRSGQRLPTISNPQSQNLARSHTFENSAKHTSQPSAFVENRRTLDETLFVTHRLHRRIQVIWFESFQDLSMFRSFDSDVFPMDDDLYFRLQEAQCHYVRDVLLVDWIPRVQQEFLSAPESTWVGPAMHNRFLASIKCLMGLQLAHLLLGFAEQLGAFFLQHHEHSAPVFVVRLAVDAAGRIGYDPDPGHILEQMHRLLRCARTAVCAVPALHSDLCADPSYCGSHLLSEARVDTILAGTARHLEGVLQERQVGLEELLGRYLRYEHLFAEPYFHFTDEWTDPGLWKESEKVWRALFSRTKLLRHRILSLSPSQVTLGVFRVTIASDEESDSSSGDTRARLAAPALASKAASLLNHVGATVTGKLFADAMCLLSDLEPVFALCDEKSDDAPRLVEISSAIEEARGGVKSASQRSKLLMQKLEFLWSVEVALSDEECFAALKSIWMAANIKNKLVDASARFAEHRWIVEDDLLTKRRDIDAFVDRFQHKEMTHILSFVSTNQVEDYLAYLNQTVAMLEGILRQSNDIMSTEEHIGLPVVSFHLLDKTVASVKLHRLLWEYAANVTEILKLWQKMVAVDVNVERLNKTSKAWLDDFDIMLQEFPPEKACHQIASLLQRQVYRFSRLVPVLRVWTSKSLRQRHWNEIFSTLNQPIDDPQLVTIGDLQIWVVHKKCEYLVQIERIATAENRTSEEIENMMAFWEARSLPIRVHSKSRTFCIESFREVNAVLLDHMMKAEQLASQPSIGHNLEKLSAWRERIVRFQRAVRLWAEVQARYLKALPFYSQSRFDFLKAETDLFNNVNHLWCELMSGVAKGPSWRTVSDDESLHSRLTVLDNALTMLAPSLEKYLEQARSLCARLYFVSEDELSDILACGYDETSRINGHIGRLYPGVICLESQIVDGPFNAVLSEFNERIDLIPVIHTHGVRPELWLSCVSQRLSSAICKEINRARKSYRDSALREWVGQHAQQSSSVAYAINFISDVEQALVSHSCFSDLMRILQLKENDLKDFSCFLTTNDLSSILERKKFASMLILAANQRDLVCFLVKESKMNGVSDFEWQSQIRFYWRSPKPSTEEGVNVQIMHRTYTYGMEYFGNQPIIIVTKSLRKIFRIIGVALGMHLGGALLGPSGNGKAMIVSEVACMFGMPCFLFECNKDSSVQVIRRICKGVAASGHWLCMQGFNSMSLGAIAVFRTSMLCIQQMLRSQQRRCIFQGDEVQILSHYIEDTPLCVSFLSLTAGEDIRVFPETLRGIYRPIFVENPDIEYILNVMLSSCGCDSSLASRLSRKLVVFYRELSNQLPDATKAHFSSGSLLKAVCCIASKTSDPKGFQEKSFLYTLVSSKSALCGESLKLFGEVLRDVFRDTDYILALAERQDTTTKIVGKEINEGFPRMNLSTTFIITPMLEGKLGQIYDSLNFHTGVVILGESLNGKSECIKNMADVFGKQHTLNFGQPQHVETVFIYPNTLSNSRLFGIINDGRWNSRKGLLPSLLGVAREISQSQSAVSQTWLVFDGTMDSDWCDQLTHILSSSKSMQLNSGEVLKTPDTVKYIFEDSDLATVSPAMVSQCGSVYLPKNNEFWVTYIHSRLKHLDKRIISAWIQSGDTNFVCSLPVLENMVDRILKPCLSFVDAECHQSEHVTSRMHNALNICSFFENVSLETLNTKALKFKFDGRWADASKLHHDSSVQDPYASTDWIHVCFLFSMIWTIGAVLSNPERKKFELFMRELCSNTAFVVEAEKRTGRKLKHEFKLHNILPKSGSLFDYAFQEASQSQSGWIQWSEISLSMPSDILIFDSLVDIVVPTVDCRKYVQLLRWMLYSHRPVVLTGPPAVGKTFYVKCAVGQESQRNVSRIAVQLSASTTSDILQGIMEARLEMKRTSVLSPTDSSYLIAHIEDLNLPCSGVRRHSPLELIRQFLDCRGWYAITEPVFQQVESVHIVAAMQTCDVNMKHMPKRLMSHFHSLNIACINEADIRSIFRSCLMWYHSKFGFPEFVRDLESKIVIASLEVLEKVRASLKPKPMNPHYLFSFHDLKSVLFGMTLQTVDNLQISIDSLPTSEHLRLWVHEILRVFYDRISSIQDQLWFLNMIKQVIRDHLNQDFDQLFKHLDTNKSGTVDSEELRSLYFGNYMQDSGKRELRSYDEVQDVALLLKTVRNYADSYYRNQGDQMQLIITKGIVEHFSRVSRVFQIKGGNALLIGRPGIGRQSTVRLAAHAAGLQMFEFNFKHSTSSWRVFLKTVIYSTLTGDAGSVLLLSCIKMQDDSFEDLNCILNGSEIPELFSKTEKLSLLKQARSEHVGCFSDFYETKLPSLHVIVCLNSQENLNEIFIKYPVLINRCSIDWFPDWTLENLREFSFVYFSHHCPPTQIIIECKEQENLNVWAQMCANYHCTAYDVYNTYHQKREESIFSYCAYKYFLSLFRSLSCEQMKLANQDKDRIQNFLEIQQNALKVVSSEDEELSAEAALLLQLEKEEHSIQHGIQSVNAQLLDLLIEHEKTASDSEKATSCIAELEESIDQIQESLSPKWQESMKVLESTTAREISKFKSLLGLANFSSACLQTLALAVYALLEGKTSEECAQENVSSLKEVGNDDIFAPAYKLVVGSDFKTRLLGISRTSAAFERGVNIVKNCYLPEKDFNESEIARACNGAEKLFQWVLSMIGYQESSEAVLRPVLERISAEKFEISSACHKKQKFEEVSSNLRNKIACFQQDAEQASNAKSRTLAKCEKIKANARLASRVISVACNSFINLPEELGDLLLSYRRSIQNMDSNCLLGAASISYLGYMSHQARQFCLASWAKHFSESAMHFDPNFNVITFLLNSIQSSFIDDCEASGITCSDDYAIMNACILELRTRNPLIVDSLGAVARWITNKEMKNSLVTVSVNDSTLHSKTKFAIEEGFPLLVRGESIIRELALKLPRTIFEKEFQMHWSGMDSSIRVQTGFRLYTVVEARISGDDLDIVRNMLLIDFSLGPRGLDRHFCDKIVQAKSPELNCFYNNLLISLAIDSQLLHSKNPKFAFEGIVIEDPSSVIDVEIHMDKWLEQRSTVMEKRRRLHKLQDRLEIMSTLTRSIVVVYQTMVSMGIFHDAYETGYDVFISSVLHHINSGEKRFSTSRSHQNSILTRYLTDCLEDEEKIPENIFDQVTQTFQALSKHIFESMVLEMMSSFYEEHRLIFLFSVSVKSLLESNNVSVEEWQHFLTEGGVMIPAGSEIPRTAKLVVETEDSIIFGGFGRHGTKNTRGKHLHTKPAYDWLPDSAWASACRLSNIRSLNRNIEEGSVMESIRARPVQWKAYLESLDANVCLENCNPISSLTPFQNLLLRRTFHPSSLYAGIICFLKETLGSNFSNPLPVSVTSAFEHSHPTAPIMFLIGSGDDPSREIEAYAKLKGFKDRFFVLNTITQNSEEFTTVPPEICDSIEKGNWILIQNIQNSICNMLTVLAVSTLAKAGCHADFRLWITAEPIRLPKSIYLCCQRAVWMTPSSIRLNLIRAFMSDPISDEEFFFMQENPAQFKRCLFALCFLNSLAIERSSCDPACWNPSIQVNYFDLTSGLCILRETLTAFPQVSIRDLRALVGEVVYGCRLGNDLDQKILSALTANVFSENVLSLGCSFDAENIYFIPDYLHLESFLSYAIALPFISPASLFGLHNDLKNEQLSLIAYGLICGLQVMEGLSHTCSNKVVTFASPWLVENIMQPKVEHILFLLPQCLDIDHVESDFPIHHKESRNFILQQEAQMYNGLLALIKNSLISLIEGLSGNQLLSTEMEQLSKCIYEGIIPIIWRKRSIPTQKELSKYILFIRESASFFSRWIRAGTPVEMWVPGFFFPQALRTASLVNFSHHLGVVVEDVGLIFKVISEAPNVLHVPVSAGLYLTGIFMARGRWDIKNEQISEDNTRDCVSLPVLHMIPYIKSAQLTSCINSYSCPMNRILAWQENIQQSGQSQNFVMYVNLPCAGGCTSDQFLLRGTRLVIEDLQS